MLRAREPALHAHSRYSGCMRASRACVRAAFAVRGMASCCRADTCCAALQRREHAKHRSLHLPGGTVIALPMQGPNAATA